MIKEVEYTGIKHVYNEKLENLKYISNSEYMVI